MQEPHQGNMSSGCTCTSRCSKYACLKSMSMNSTPLAKCLGLLTSTLVRKPLPWECARRCGRMTTLPVRIVAMGIAWQKVLRLTVCTPNCWAKSLAIVKAKAVPCISPTRNEEHTSELQSPCNLVCRLLLEKKKKNVDQLRLLHDTPSEDLTLW